MLPILALGALAFLLFKRVKQKPGVGPFDKLPAGVSGVAKAAAYLAQSSQRLYKLNGFPPDKTGRSYVIAQLQSLGPGKPATDSNTWVAFWQSSAGRKFASASAKDPAQLKQLVSDLKVQR